MIRRGSLGAGGVVLLGLVLGCGPRAGVPSAGSETSGEGSTHDSPTATSTSSAGTTESSTTYETSGETTLETGDGADTSSSSSGPVDVDHCARCGPDEVCIDKVDDTCAPWRVNCVPIPEACEVVTCDAPACAGALCGRFDCLGYGALACDGRISDGFVCVSRGGIECDQWANDCPEGEKCNAWSDDNDVYDHTLCIPVARMPVAVGEPCSVAEYALSGVDDCAFGAQCLEVDPVTLTGTCRATCTGSRGNPSCEDPELTCTVNDHGHGWCLP